MSRTSAVRYRIARSAGRAVTETAARVTLGHMPPFVSASVVVMQQDRLLVVQDPLRHEPILPGGHLRWTESPEDAAIRETHEETGFTVQVLGLVGVYTGMLVAGERGIVRIVYAATIDGGSLRSSGEGEATWIDARAYGGSSGRDAPIVRDVLDQSSAPDAAPST